jgi:hypothetical protein
MRTIVLALSLLALAVPSAVAQKAKGKADNDATMKHCHEMAGKEVGEGEMSAGRNRLIVQRWSDCMMGMPHTRQ